MRKRRQTPDEHQSVTDWTAFGHGGDWTGTFLDFSANTSPFPVPVEVRTALREAADTLERYPDPLCRLLCRRIGEREGIPAEQVLCGNGASDCIYRAALAKRPRRAVIPAPSFSEYEAALRLSGCGEIVRYPLQAPREFRLDEGFLHALTPGTDMVFLCQPNNPTGVTIPKPLLLRVLDRCREIRCLLVVDECFLGFLEEPEAFTLRVALPETPQLLLIRAFTKLYSLAGVRLGYALCSDRAFLETMRRSGPPWSVSSLAQAAGLAALNAEGNENGIVCANVTDCANTAGYANTADYTNTTGYANAARVLIARERPRLYGALRGLGLRVIPGEANFLLFQSPVPLDAPLRERGILLRNCGNFHGLDIGWYRTAVRTPSENRRLVAALEEILAEYAVVCGPHEGVREEVRGHGGPGHPRRD